MATARETERGEVGSRDDRIAEVVKALREVAEHDLGFTKQGTRADNEIELRGKHGLRVRLWTNTVHGEGRVIVVIHKGSDGRAGNNDGPPRVKTREIKVWGRDSAAAEIERGRSELMNIVRRATAVKP